MPNKEKRKAAGISDALVGVLRPIAQIMIQQGLGVGELIQAVKLAYLQAAVSEVTPKGRKANVSRLSVVTGLTRKEIAALLKSDGARPARATPKSLQQRALRVLQGWCVDPGFQRPDGRPADLPLQGGRDSFARLVKQHGADVTPMSVLRELERMKAATLTASGKVKFQRRGPKVDAQGTARLAEFAPLLRDFVSTVSQVPSRDRPTLFSGFKDARVGSIEQAALFQRTFSTRAAALLGSVEQWMAHQHDTERGRQAPKPSARVGLGVYLVREDPQ